MGARREDGLEAGGGHAGESLRGGTRSEPEGRFVAGVEALGQRHRHRQGLHLCGRLRRAAAGVGGCGRELGSGVPKLAESGKVSTQFGWTRAILAWPLPL